MAACRMALFGQQWLRDKLSLGRTPDLGGSNQYPVIFVGPAHRPRSLPTTSRTWVFAAESGCSELVARNSSEMRELPPLQCGGRQNPNHIGWAIAQTHIRQHGTASLGPYIIQLARASSRKKSALDTDVHYDRHSSPHYERW